MISKFTSCMIKVMFSFLFISLTTVSAETSLPENSKDKQKKTDSVQFKVIKEAPHNTQSFTQGFDLEGDIFYESSGLYGRSFIEVYTDKNLLKRQQLPKQLFAEGLVKVGDKLFVLTWKSQTLLIVDAKTLKLLNTIKYKGEGWGITHDGEQFISSDGSSHIFFRDDKFNIVKTITVKEGIKIYSKINELEYANGYIWANAWQSNFVLKIDPKNGDIVNKYDLTDLVKVNSTRPSHTVLNGLAFDSENEAFWVTGKLWPKRYLIKFD